MIVGNLMPAEIFNLSFFEKRCSTLEVVNLRYVNEVARERFMFYNYFSNKFIFLFNGILFDAQIVKGAEVTP